MSSSEKSAASPEPLEPVPEGSGEIVDSSPTQDEEIATHLILLVCVVAYGFLCMPAVMQRGYPPIDPFWDAVPWVWPFPIILSGLFTAGYSRSRWWAVAIYAVGTAFFASGTQPMVVPNSPSATKMAVFTLIFQGPLHLLIAAILESVVQESRKLFHALLASRAWVRLGLKLVVATAIAAVMVALPFSVRALVFANARQRARERVEQDWLEQHVVVYKRQEYGPHGDLHVESGFDPDSGFRIEGWPRYFGYEEAYNQRVNELIAERGYPKWSMKEHLKCVEVASDMLDSTEMQPVEFPFELSSGVRLEFVTLPGVGEGDVSLKIVGPNAPQVVRGRDRQFSQIYEVSPALAVGRHPKFPEVVFVRAAKGSYVEAYHTSGRLLFGASRMRLRIKDE